MLPIVAANTEIPATRGLGDPNRQVEREKALEVTAWAALILVVSCSAGFLRVW